MKEAQKRGIVIDTGFAGHIHTDFGVLYQAIRAGIVPDVISTDLTRFSAFTRGGRYGMTMCMSIARDAEMREEDIFRAITANPAKALGKDNEWGYLRVGRAADIAVLDYTNESFDLTDGAGNHIRGNMGYRCVLTVSDGQVVFKD
jgi:dihydroorotase